MTFISFNIENEIYAIPIEPIVEIQDYNQNLITKIPQSKTFIEGILNTLNKLIPLINFKRFLAIKRDTMEQKVIILKNDSFYISILIDKINKIIEIPDFNNKRKMNNNNDFLLNVINYKGVPLKIFDTTSFFEACQKIGK